MEYPWLHNLRSITFLSRASDSGDTLDKVLMRGLAKGDTFSYGKDAEMREEWEVIH